MTGFPDCLLVPHIDIDIGNLDPPHDGNTATFSSAADVVTLRRGADENCQVWYWLFSSLLLCWFCTHQWQNSSFCVSLIAGCQTWGRVFGAFSRCDLFTAWECEHIPLSLWAAALLTHAWLDRVHAHFHMMRTERLRALQSKARTQELLRCELCCSLCMEMFYLWISSCSQNLIINERNIFSLT